jgi:hypothetical protein
VPTQTIDFERRFFVQGYDCLHLIGGNEADILVNETNLPALIEGNGGNDQLVGGASIDVLFAGGGLDVLIGGSGDDYLFADVGLAFTGSQAAPTPVASPGSPFADPPGFDPADLLFGGPGLNHAAQVGLDLVSGISGMLLDGGATKDVVSWLRAQLMAFSSGNLQMLINNAFFGGNGKVGLANAGCDIEDFAVDRFPLAANARPAAPMPLFGPTVDGDAQDAEATAAAAKARLAAADDGLEPLREAIFSDLSWMSFGQ